MEKIVGVAVVYNGTLYSLPAPNRHHNVFRVINNVAGGCGFTNEGFITTSGVFLNRKEAMQLAKENGQLNRRQGSQYYQGPELYSEDLW